MSIVQFLTVLRIRGSKLKIQFNEIKKKNEENNKEGQKNGLINLLQVMIYYILKVR